MDCVEREFENRDENVRALEMRLADYKSVIANLQSDVDSANDVIASMQDDLDKSLAQQKVGRRKGNRSIVLAN